METVKSIKIPSDTQMASEELILKLVEWGILEITEEGIKCVEKEK